MSAPTTIDCVIAGSAGSGKSSLVRRWTTRMYSHRRLPNPDGYVQIKCKTNRGPVVFRVREESSDILLGSKLDTPVILLVDVTNKPAFEELKNALTPSAIPIDNLIVCATKVDNKHQTVSSSEIRDWASGHTCYDVSSKSCYNFEKPLVYLARSRLGQDTRIM